MKIPMVHIIRASRLKMTMVYNNRISSLIKHSLKFRNSSFWLGMSSIFLSIPYICGKLFLCRRLNSVELSIELQNSKFKIDDKAYSHPAKRAACNKKLNSTENLIVWNIITRANASRCSIRVKLNDVVQVPLFITSVTQAWVANFHWDRTKILVCWFLNPFRALGRNRGRCVIQYTSIINDVGSLGAIVDARSVHAINSNDFYQWQYFINGCSMYYYLRVFYDQPLSDNQNKCIISGY